MNVRNPLHFGATLRIKHQVNYADDPASHFMPDFHVAYQPGSADFSTEPDRYMTELVKTKTDMKDTLDRIHDKTDPIDILIDDQSGNVVATLKTQWNGTDELIRQAGESARQFMDRVLSFATDKSKTLMFPQERGKMLVNQLLESLIASTDYAFERLYTLDGIGQVFPPKVSNELRHIQQYVAKTTNHEWDFGDYQIKDNVEYSHTPSYTAYRDGTALEKHTLSLSNHPNGATITFWVHYGLSCLHPSDRRISKVALSQPSPTKGMEAEEISMQITPDRKYDACEFLGGQGVFEDAQLKQNLETIRNRGLRLIQSLAASSQYKSSMS